ncbi:MAG: hypothetical protein JST33_13575 [Actinobacteria bacterium]|nr:hypothetical protein [Actinomycetota bacterium]
MSRPRGTRFIAMLLPAASGAVLAGCAPWSPQAQAERSARQGLERLVDQSLDRIWEFRERLVADPEAALPEISGLADVRTANHPGTWLMTDLGRNAAGTTLTLTGSSSGEAGGGLFFAQVSLRTCWRLVMAADGSRIDARAADCDAPPESSGLPAEFVALPLVPLDHLSVRDRGTAADYPAPPCQCRSGVPCDCPGG